MVCLLLCGAESEDDLLLVGWLEVGAERFGIGFGRAETPQFVKPRIIPPLVRISLPAVRAILLHSLEWTKRNMSIRGECTLLLRRWSAAAPVGVSIDSIEAERGRGYGGYQFVQHDVVVLVVAFGMSLTKYLDFHCQARAILINSARIAVPPKKNTTPQQWPPDFQLPV